MGRQLVKTKLFPVEGLTLQDPAPDDLFMVGDGQLGFTWGLLKANIGSVLWEGTSTGAAKVALTGSGSETYATNTGNSADAYAAGQTHEDATGWDSVRLLVEANDVIVSLKDAQGNWGDDEIFGVGNYELPIACYGVKVKSRLSGQSGFYQMTGRA